MAEKLKIGKRHVAEQREPAGQQEKHDGRKPQGQPESRVHREMCFPSTTVIYRYGGTPAGTGTRALPSISDPENDKKWQAFDDKVCQLR
jgi:hypothetical protein